MEHYVNTSGSYQFCEMQKLEIVDWTALCVVCIMQINSGASLLTKTSSHYYCSVLSALLPFLY